MVNGYEPNLAMYAQHGWYDWVYYLDEHGDQKLARWLGVAEDIGSGDCYMLLPSTCKPIARSTVWPVPQEDMSVDEKIKEREVSIDICKRKQTTRTTMGFSICEISDRFTEVVKRQSHEPSSVHLGFIIYIIPRSVEHDVRCSGAVVGRCHSVVN
jgi:hypothetical protein